MTADPIDKPNWHHFSIKERIDFLLYSCSESDCLKKHNKKLRKAIAIYFIIIALIFTAGLKLQDLGKTDFYNKKVTDYIMYQLNEKGLESPQLYHYLGDIMVENRKYNQAVNAYKKALFLDPNSVDTLNNLAWLYITSEDKEMQNIKLGIKLAERGVSISKFPPAHILDTLAEGYFRIHEYEKACLIANQAYKKAQDNKKYYQDQIDKICKN